MVVLSQRERERWGERVRRAGALMKEHHARWRKLLAYYRNKYYQIEELEELTEHRVRANYIFSTIRTILPAIYFQNPYLLVQPRRVGVDEQAAIILETAVNYYFKELNLKQQIRLCTLDTLLFGTGFVKIGYSAEFGEVTPMTAPDTEALTQYLNQAILNEAMTGMDATAGTLAAPHDNRFPGILNEYIRQESPFVVRVSPFDLRVDPDAVTLADAGWVAHRTIRSLKELRQNEYYAHTDQIEGTRGDDDREAPVGERRRHETDDWPDTEAEDRVVLWEVWEKAEERVIWFCEAYQPDALRVESWPDLYQMEGFPFEALQFEEDPERFWPVSLVAQIEDQVRTINEYTSKQVNHTRRFNRKYKLLDKAWSDETMQTLLNPADGAIIKVPTMEALQALEDAPLSPDVYNGLVEQKNALYEISGVTDYARGFAPRSRTATEAAIMAQGQNLRILEKVDLLEEFVGRIGRKLIQVLKQYAPEQQLVSITGRSGNRQWEWLSKATIQGEVDVVVEAGSTQAPNKEVRKKQALDLYNLLRADPLIAPAALITQLLDTYDVKDPESYFAPHGPNPSEIAHAQLENLVMAQGQPAHVVPQNDHGAHMQVHQAFMNDPRWGQVLPQNQQLIGAHMQQHEAIMQEMSSQRGGGRPRTLSPEAGRPVNPAIFTERTPTMARMTGSTQGV